MTAKTSAGCKVASCAAAIRCLTVFVSVSSSLPMAPWPGGQPVTPTCTGSSPANRVNRSTSTAQPRSAGPWCVATGTARSRAVIGRPPSATCTLLGRERRRHHRRVQRNPTVRPPPPVPPRQGVDRHRQWRPRRLHPARWHESPTPIRRAPTTCQRSTMSGTSVKPSAAAAGRNDASKATKSSSRPSAARATIAVASCTASYARNP